MRALGVDLGTKRIGVAICDSAGILATPLTVIERSGNKKVDHKSLDDLVVEEGVGIIVVGLPKDLRGQTAIAATNALAEVAQMTTVMSVPVETYDERMTTALAAKQMGGSRKDRKAKIDAMAAAVILQGWLDSRS